MTSPVGSLTQHLLTLCSSNVELSSFFTSPARARLMRAVFSAYYAEKADDMVIFDTNRAWAGRIAEVLHIFPDARFIACVRDPSMILDSVERVLERDPMRLSSLTAPGENIAQRARRMISPGGFIGDPLANLKKAVFGPHSERVMILEYDALCFDPGTAIDAVYRFVNLPAYDHDFENVRYTAERFDEHLNTPGLHTVHGPVRWQEREPMLPSEIVEDLSAQQFWNAPMRSRCARVLLGAKEQGNTKHDTDHEVPTDETRKIAHA
ncbi:sulfotransferase [Rhodovulum imhoffii]|uniref:Sulfotransferase n=2 Tax=Rhodovulum imhoffii TaxID=365340 RepID=A0A2T5BP78_9RHOB|nr:sulfotransferase [Rhodovulum imhoffii]